jgi:hypothetical protein
MLYLPILFAPKERIGSILDVAKKLQNPGAVALMALRLFGDFRTADKNTGQRAYR